MNKKIVVLDGLTENPGDLSWKPLEALGDLVVYDRTPTEKIVERIGDAQIILTNKTLITGKTINHCPNLEYIGVLATGYNVVDVETAKSKSITVTNIPSYGTDSVAQFAFALLLEICHHVGHHSDAVKSGRWAKCEDFCFWDFPLIELTGKSIGIIGYGRIGQATGKLSKAFGMKVLAYDAYQNMNLEDSQCRYVELEDLLKQSDIIALHCPLFPETEGIIRKETIEKMKDGVIIINNSRGPLIVEQDLADALNSGKVAGAGVDVVSKEPIDMNNPLLLAKNCLVTPHISWAAKESRQRLMDTAVENIEKYLLKSPVNVVS